MANFDLWAPRAKRVEIEMAGRRRAMARGANGWWSIRASEANDCEYSFVIDGGEPLPDPRSPWQPNGVFGRSRCVDHGQFAWTDSNWQPRPLSAAVIYEIHIGTFTAEGTFRSAIDKLDDLVQLGITHIELMPVAEFSGARGWGYDGTLPYAPHHAYGTPDDLKRFVNACHTRGLAVLLDVVYNHLGPVGNNLARFGPYFTKRYATPWGEAMNFDGPESGEVRRFFCDNALMWLRDYHFDGLRIDAVHAIIDSSAIHFLEQLACEVAALQAQIGRHLVLIAESDLNDPRLVQPQAIGGYGMDAQWSDDFHHALHSLLTGEKDGYYVDFGSMADLAKALKQGFVYDGCYSSFRRRRHGRRPHAISGNAFLGYFQNHDQIGNRATGERSFHLLPVSRLKIAAAFVFTAPFIPMLFQGEEWGASSPFLYFTDHRDPAVGQAVTTGRSAEFARFGWNVDDLPDPQARDTFERSKLNWNERTQEPHAELLEWHRRLIQLRRNTAALTDGRLERVQVNFDEAARWLVMERGPVALACNLNQLTQVVPTRLSSYGKILLASEKRAQIFDGELILPADSAAIIKSAVSASD
jgi:maltooligosyltrehalose trehalohydrolase